MRSRDRHAPRGIDHEQDQVGGFADAHFALKIALAQGIRHAGFALLLLAGALKRRGGAQRGVEGDVVGLAVGGARLHVAPALAVGVRARAPTRLLARHLVERGLQLARGKFRAGLDLLAAFPPVRIVIIEHVLRRRVGLTEIRHFFVGFSGYRGTFFLTACCSPSSAR